MDMSKSILGSIVALSSAIYVTTLDYIDIQAYEAMGSIKGEKREDDPRKEKKKKRDMSISTAHVHQRPKIIVHPRNLRKKKERRRPHCDTQTRYEIFPPK
jgi:hypothetical protein